MGYIKKFLHFVYESGKGELFWKFIGWIGAHYLVGSSVFFMSLAISSWAWFLSAPAFAAVFLFVIAFSLLISASHFVFGPLASGTGNESGPLRLQSRPLKMRGFLEQSQITLWGQFDLQVDVAVRFENSGTTQRFLRGFSTYITRGGSREKLGQPPSLIEVSAQSRIVTLDNGHAIQPGISPLYYVKFSVPSFTKEDQCFQIEMEALGQSPQRIEIVPNWSNVQPLLLNADTIKEIRYLN